MIMHAVQQRLIDVSTWTLSELSDEPVVYCNNGRAYLPVTIEVEVEENE